MKYLEITPKGETNRALIPEQNIGLIFETSVGRANVILKNVSGTGFIISEESFDEVKAKLED